MLVPTFHPEPGLVFAFISRVKASSKENSRVNPLWDFCGLLLVLEPSHHRTCLGHEIGLMFSFP